MTQTPVDQEALESEALYGVSDELLEHIRDALENDQETQVFELVESLHAADIADIIYQLASGSREKFVKTIENSSDKLILMMDVLEHVADDVALLKYYADSMDAGGYVFITVPAFQFMWSGHDIFLEHHRRYTIKTLETVAKKAGMTPIKSRYFFASLFPAIASIRLVEKVILDRDGLKPKSDLKLYPEWLNSILVTIHDIELHTLFAFNKGFGLSVCCLCRKD